VRSNQHNHSNQTNPNGETTCRARKTRTSPGPVRRKSATSTAPRSPTTGGSSGPTSSPSGPWSGSGAWRPTAYNNGELHGDWVDAAVESEELVRSAQEILSRSPEPDAEEWAIFDFDEFGSYRVEQYDPLEHVARIARGIKEHGHAFAAWAELHDGDEAMLAGFEDAFLGEYESLEAWGREVLDELNLVGFLRMGAIPEAIRPYLHIDYEGWARDAELGGDVYIERVPGGGIYVFSTL